MRSLTLAPLILAAALVADASAEPVYESFRVPADSAPLLLDADDDVWGRARRIAWGPKEYQTTFRALWNDGGLFVRFDASDPDPWHTLTQRDARLPWKGLQTVPPRPGDQWSFNVFRIERPGGISNSDRDALFLAWSPTGERSFHVPEAFGDLLFR